MKIDINDYWIRQMGNLADNEQILNEGVNCLKHNGYYMYQLIITLRNLILIKECTYWLSHYSQNK
jgi:hypothetical protein